MKILVIGGKGFLGRRVCKYLEKPFTMDRSKGKDNHVRGSLEDLALLKKIIPEFDVIVNLVGLSPLKNPKGTSYKDVHIKGVRNLLFSMTSKQRLIQVSALGASSESDAEYLRTKGKAEDLIKNSGKDYCIVRPSFLFGKDNEFFRTLDIAKHFWFFPRIKTKMQPIFVDDVAKIISKACTKKIRKKELELGGSKVYSIFDVARLYTHRTLIPIPWFLFKASYWLVSRTRLFGITPEQYKILLHDNICKKNNAQDYLKLEEFDEWVEKI